MVNHTGFETGPWCTAQADLELLTPLLRLTEYWDATCLLLLLSGSYHGLGVAFLRNKVLSYVACELAVLLLLAPRARITDTHSTTSCLMTHLLSQRIVKRYCETKFPLLFSLLESEPRHHTY